MPKNKSTASPSPSSALPSGLSDTELAPEELGLESNVVSGDHLALRVWLRLLSCSMQMETEVRKRMRSEFDISLARFDYLAQLDRHPEGLTMSQVSRCLMVTGGNVTGLTNELENEGLLRRSVDPADRRSFYIRMTPKGRRLFRKIAADHEAQVVSMLSGMEQGRQEQLYQLLGELRGRLSAANQVENQAEYPA